MRIKRKDFFLMAAKVWVFCVIGLTGCGGDGAPYGDGGKVQNSERSLNLTLDDLFPTNRLLRVDIQITDKDWDILRNQTRTIQQALQANRKVSPPDSPYTYLEASLTIDGVTFPRVGLRKKGFIGSQSVSRPSLKVDLNFIDKTANIDGVTTLTLNNNQQDNSLMSQFIGYSLFNAAGAPAPRCALAKVTVNGKNLGVYAHVESAKKPLVQRAFGNSNGTLYEGTLVDFLDNWESSFERKFGKDEPGREHILKVIHALNDGNGEAFFGGDALGRAWVPTSSQNEADWFKPDFDDSDWMVGTNGAGYERERGYEGFIREGFDLEHQMFGKSTSVYLRFPFEITQLNTIISAKRQILRMRCDDGFVAYINGHEVARFNAPGSVHWDSQAPGTRDDQALMSFSTYDISMHKDKFQEGRNVLAIQGLNVSKESTDLLLVAELQTSDTDLEKELWELIDEEAFYRFWTMEGLLSFWDGYSGNRNNFFVYLNPDNNKFHFLPWGADSLFEKYSRIGEDPNSPRSVRTVGRIAHKLYQIPSVRKKYAARMKQLLTDHWDEEKLLAETQRIQAMVDPHLSREQRGWFFDRKVDYESIRHFIRTRRADIEREIHGEDMPLWNVPPEIPPLL